MSQLIGRFVLVVEGPPGRQFRFVSSTPPWSVGDTATRHASALDEGTSVTPDASRRDVAISA